MFDRKKRAASTNICHQVHLLSGPPSPRLLDSPFNHGVYVPETLGQQLSNVQDREHRSAFRRIGSPHFSEKHARVNPGWGQTGLVLRVMNYRIFTVSKVSDTCGPETHGARTQEEERKNREMRDGIQRGRSGSDLGES